MSLSNHMIHTLLMPHDLQVNSTEGQQCQYSMRSAWPHPPTLRKAMRRSAMGAMSTLCTHWALSPVRGSRNRMCSAHVEDTHIV